MKTLQEICVEINGMSPQEVETDGPKLLEHYVKQKISVLTLYNIYEKLEPYVNQKVKSFWKNKLGERYVPLNGSPLLLCSAGVTVERTVADLGITGETDRWVKETEYTAFANFINIAADAGLIEFGVAVEPCELPLAIISAGRRTMLLFYTYTTKSLQQLRSYSNLFTNEGELPVALGEIVFNASGKFDYQNWANNRWNR